MENEELKAFDTAATKVDDCCREVPQGTSYHENDFMCTLGAFLVFLFLPVVVEPICLFTDHIFQDNFFYQALHMTYYQIGTFLFIVMFIARKYPHAALSDVLHFHWFQKKNVKPFFICLLFMLVFVSMASRLTDLIQKKLSLDLEIQEVVSVSVSCSWSDFFILSLSVTLLAPVLEEIMFRRFLHGWLAKHMPWWGATIIASAIFSAAHLNLLQTLPLFALAMVLQDTYRRTESLLEPILLHMLLNSSTIVLVLLVRYGVFTTEEVSL